MLRSAAPGSALQIELGLGITRLGNDPSCQIVLLGDQVSAIHAEIQVGAARVLLRDLNSSRGTSLNGRRVRVAALHHGDLLTFADQFSFRLVLRVPRELAAAEQPRCSVRRQDLRPLHLRPTIS